MRPFRLSLCLPVLLWGLGTSALAQPACDNGGHSIFSCTTTRGKVVQVCDAGPTIAYSFGKPGAKPEMALAVPRARAQTYQWTGIGRHSNYAVHIPNGDTVYAVFTSLDRLAEPEPQLSAGIYVEVKGRHVATIDCQLDTLQEQLEGIDLPTACALRASGARCGQRCRPGRSRSKNLGLSRKNLPPRRCRTSICANFSNY